MEELSCVSVILTWLNIVHLQTIYHFIEFNNLVDR